MGERSQGRALEGDNSRWQAQLEQSIRGAPGGGVGDGGGSGDDDADT